MVQMALDLMGARSKIERAKKHISDFDHFRGFAQCGLRKGGTLKVDKLDRLPVLHIHRNQSKVRTTVHSIP
jgi:hypothetical protein